MLIVGFWLHRVFTAACGLPCVVASRGCRLWCAGLSLRDLLLLRSPGSRMLRLQSFRHMGLVAPRHVGSYSLIKPVSPALPGGFSTTGPPGMPWCVYF